MDTTVILTCLFNHYRLSRRFVSVNKFFLPRIINHSSSRCRSATNFLETVRRFNDDWTNQRWSRADCFVRTDYRKLINGREYEWKIRYICRLTRVYVREFDSRAARVSSLSLLFNVVLRWPFQLRDSYWFGKRPFGFVPRRGPILRNKTIIRVSVYATGLLFIRVWRERRDRHHSTMIFFADIVFAAVFVLRSYCGSSGISLGTRFLFIPFLFFLSVSFRRNWSLCFHLRVDRSSGNSDFTVKIGTFVRVSFVF